MHRSKTRPKPPILTREQCRAVDKYAIEQLGIPGVVLMENAGRNAADLIESWMLKRRPHSAGGLEPGVCIVCGKGNNGGDGFVVARHLFNRGYPVTVDLAANAGDLTGDAAVNSEIARHMGIAIRELADISAVELAAQGWRKATVIVDALLGTGFSGEVREPLAGIMHRINAGSSPSGPLIVAIDVPSGLDADTGVAAGPAIRAHRTITFLARKSGYQNKTARAYLGRLFVADIGAPLELILERLGTPS
jgi:NAD(P)H-hydrate epimerase